MEFLVTSEVLRAVGEAVLLAHPQEACGILLGKGATVTAFVEAANVHLSPETHFEIDPQALINAHRNEREGGLRVLGYFHSHPNGPAKPSKTDQEQAAGDGMLWAIWGEGSLAMWRDEQSGFRQVSYRLGGG